VYVAGSYGTTKPTLYSNYIGVVSTLAGSGVNSYGDGTGTSSGFSAPNSVTIDSAGNVYVADSSNYRIRKITSAGVVSTFAGSGTSTYLDATGTSAGFNSPYGIAVDSAGNVYVGDTNNHRIRKITSAGVVTTLAGSGVASYADGTGTNAGFNTPGGIAVDSAGNVYVADQTNNRIRKITSGGVVTTLAGSGTGTYLDATGTNAGFKIPKGVAIDSVGNVYVTDWNNSRIRKIDTSGVVTTFAGGGSGDGTGTNAGFSGVFGIAVDSVGNIYVADTGINRIRKITSAGVVTTFAGSGTATYLDGTGTNAGLNQPFGVTVDSTGNVYVADTVNNRIRKIVNPATPTVSITGNAAFGLKLDSSGIAQWTVGADGINNEQALGCSTDPSGNFYLAGSYGSNSATIYNANNTTSTLTLPTASNVSAFVIKYNSGGNALWTGRVLCDSNSQVYVNSVANDAYNNVYIAGSYEGLTEPIVYGSNNAYNSNVHLPYPTGNGGSNTASFVVKYDSNGTPQNAWGIMGSSNSSPYSIAVDTYGSNISLVGMFTGPTSLYDGNSMVSTLAFPSAVTSQAGFAVNYDLVQSPVTLMSSLGVGNNGQQKYITNTGAAPITLNVTSSNNASVLSTYTINAGANSIFNWYNGSWYKFI
jgi:sugar lactone lactonase YvrE